MELVIRETRQAGFVVLAVQGEVDAATAPALRERIVAVANAGEPNLVVDLEEVGFLDSSALTALVVGRKEAIANGGSLSLVCTKPGALKVFEITQLDQLFVIHPSVAAATTS
jgi:anti-sigma B factor antagonist